MVLSSKEEGRWNEVVTELHNDIIKKNSQRDCPLAIFIYFFPKGNFC